MSEYERLLERVHKDLDRIQNKIDQLSEKVGSSVVDIALLKAGARRAGLIYGWFAGLVAGVLSQIAARVFFFRENKKIEKNG